MIALLVIVSIVAGSAPEIRVINAGMMSIAECEMQVRLMNAGLQPPGVDKQGRTIMMREYQCVLIDRFDVEDAVKAMEKAQ